MEFFGSGHGKGPHDGARTIIKHFIRCEKLNVHGTQLQNVEEVVNFLHVNLFNRPNSFYTKKKKPLHRMFWHVLFEHVDCNSNTYACDAVESTMKIHCISTTNKHVLTQLMVKPLSCFCGFCIDGKWAKWPNVNWTGD